MNRLRSGPAVTVTGAILLILGGVIVVAHHQLPGTIIAAVGGVMVVRERMRQRR